MRAAHVIAFIACLIAVVSVISVLIRRPEPSYALRLTPLFEVGEELKYVTNGSVRSDITFRVLNRSFFGGVECFRVSGERLEGGNESLRILMDEYISVEDLRPIYAVITYANETGVYATLVVDYREVGVIYSNLSMGEKFSSKRISAAEKTYDSLSLIFLLRSISEPPNGTVTLSYLSSDLKVVKLELTYLGRETISVGDKRYASDKYLVIIGKDETYVWIDTGPDKRILQMLRIVEGGSILMWIVEG